jgi:hypothetical protein
MKYLCQVDLLNDPRKGFSFSAGFSTKCQDRAAKVTVAAKVLKRYSINGICGQKETMVC